MAEILMVPIHLDALYLKKDRSVVETMADFSRLPYCDGNRDINPDVANLSEEILSQPFEDRGLELKAGVHLHWALPDALTRGFQPRPRKRNGSGNENERSIIFPYVPNRWLVTRTDSGGGDRQWVVESDYLHPPGQNGPQSAISYPYPSTLPPQPFRYLGRKLPFAAWKKRDATAKYLGALTAVGYGEPTFAAFYPNCLSVFGFHDDAPPPSLQGVQYDVVGWYSEPELDCLYPKLYPKAFQEAFTQDEYNALKKEDKYKALKEVYRWVVEDPSGKPLKPLPPFPSKTICYARLTFVPDERAHDRPEERKVAVAVGNTGTEALSAYLADFCARNRELAKQSGSTILIQGAGEYKVISVPSTTSITVQNLGSTGNVPPNTQINAGADVRARDTIPIPLGKLAETSASFITPDIGGNVTVSVQTPNPADLEDQLEAIHLAGQLEGRTLDIGLKFREARHNKEFNGVMAGTLWTIRLEKSASGQANAHEAATYAEDTLPRALATKLDWLNVCQKAFDSDCDEIESLRTQLFADWCKYMMCVYPPEGHRDRYPNHDEVKYFVEKNDLFPLQKRIARNNALNFQRSQAFAKLYQEVAEVQLLIPADIKDWAKFQKRFQAQRSAPVEHISELLHDRYSLLTDGTRHLLSTQTDPLNEEAKKQTINDLNEILRTASLYKNTIFNGLALSGEAQSMAAQVTHTKISDWPYQQLLRFNRLLLEAVFPEEIAKSAPYALKSVPAPRYWQPNEPVVLIVDEVHQTVRPSLRHGRDVGLREEEEGLLRCDVIELKDAAIDELFDEIRTKIPKLRTSLTAGFTVPAVGSAATVTVENTARMGGRGDDFFVTGAGYYRVASITDAAHAVLTNVGGRSNAKPGTVIAPGADVSAKTRPGFTTWTEQPWHPFLLEWEVELMPLKGKYKQTMADDPSAVGRAYDRDCIKNSYQLKENDVDLVIQPGEETLAKESNRYYGRSILTPYAKFQLLYQIENFLEKQLLEDYYSSNSVKLEERTNDYFATNIDHIIDWYTAHLDSLPTEQLKKDKKDAFLEQILPVYKYLRSEGEDDEPGFHLLAQSLSGFNQALLAQKQTFQLPIRDPLGFADYQPFTDAVGAAVATSNRAAPQPHNDFNPIRTGILKFNKLHLVDTFGQVQKLNLQHNQVITTDVMTTPANPHLAILPPRIVQPARLNFRWLAGDDDFALEESDDPEMNSHPVSTPICGWLLPNNLDNSLMVYDARGQALGSLNRGGRWEPAPGSQRSVVRWPPPNPHLHRVVTYLQEQEKPGTGFLDAFLTVIENALENIDPEYAGGHEALALLMGRPIAVARASLNLEVQGYPAIDQDWNVFQQDMERAFQNERKIALLRERVATFEQEKATLVLAQEEFDRAERLLATKVVSQEEYEKRREALEVAKAQVAQALENVYQARVALGLEPQPPEGKTLADVLEDRNRETEDYTMVEIPIRIGEYKQLNDGLVGYWIEEEEKGKWKKYKDNTFFAPQTAPETDLPATIAVHSDQQPLNITQSISNPPHKLTLLLDPRGAVHATSGILPTKAIQIPADQFVEALRNMEVTFLSAPILTDRGKINLPLPDEPGYVWSWCAKENGVWESVTQIAQVTTGPTAAPQELREGWLKLTKKDQP